MQPKNNKKSLSLRMIIMIIFLVIVFGLIFGWGFVRSYFMKRYFATFKPPPVVISTTIVKAVSWQPYISAVGSLVASNGVQVSSEVPGIITYIYFNSGQIVKQGEPLVRLDDSTDIQDYKNLRAQLKLAQINFMRQSKLFKTGSVAASGLDEARAQLQQLEAQTEKARLLIEKKNIRAPFAGKVGIEPINTGQYIAAGTALVSLQALDPIEVEFSVPEQNLSSLFVGQGLQISVGAFNEVFSGKIAATNSEVNMQTRNILVKGVIPNPKLKLYPGMFANINVLLPKQEKVITVPQTAVTYNLYGDTVYVVKPEGKDKEGKPILKARLQYVTPGERRDSEIAVNKGLNAGDEVVISGQLKLQDGSQVIVNNSNNLTQEKPVTNG
jgi:membrane fusion protein (multidrug efflux system)